MVEFPGEPIGMEDAIGWHLRQIDHHDHNASMADAMDMDGSAKFHDDKRRAHTSRLKFLEALFPEIAKVARASLEIEYRQAGEAA